MPAARLPLPKQRPSDGRLHGASSSAGLTAVTTSPYGATMSAATKPTADELEQCLRYFTGTEEYHRHWMRRITFTDGVKFLAEQAGAYWLIDLIASWQIKQIGRAHV